MALKTFTDDLNIISKLGDNPGTDDGLTSDGLKAKFDEGNLATQKFINEEIVQPLNNMFGDGNMSPSSGLSMNGAIHMNHNSLTGLKDPEADEDAVPFGYLKNNYSLKNLNVQKQHISTTVVLYASNWANNVQTVAAKDVTADNTVIVAPSESSYTQYTENNIRVKKQEVGILTFECGIVPTVDIFVNIAIFAEGNGSATGGGDDPAITAISVTESADGTVTMVNTLEGGGTETIVISPDANGNPSKLTYNGTEIPITWTEVT